MRIRDLNVLSMNDFTNTKDPRIKAIHVPGSDRCAERRKIFDMQVPVMTISLPHACQCQVGPSHPGGLRV